MTTVSSTVPVPPPSRQEIHRKLSVHAKPKKVSMTPSGMSGTESDSDSQVATDLGSPHAHGSGGASIYASGSQQPLQSIAERRSGSGDESDEDEDEEGEWRVAAGGKGTEGEKSVVKTGYLWKKGSRRKTWKKRWFVLRSPHLAYYKTSAEYQLLRLLDLNEVHSVTPVSLKKHLNTFGLVLPTRTFYLQTETEDEVLAWVRALNEVRERLQLTASISPVPTPPINIPPRSKSETGTGLATPITPSPPNQAVTSSDEDEPPSNFSSSPGAARTLSPAKGLGAPIANDPTKVILSGYLMKCGKRKSWRKRWFVLTGEKLVYCGNHMDNKHQRQIPLAQVLDAMEYKMPSHRNGPAVQTPLPSPPIHTALDELSDPHSAHADNHTFKIVTTKRSILLCAPSEEEEIRWLSAVRALIARRSSHVGSSLMSKTSAGEGGTSATSGGAILKGGRRRSISAGGLVAAVEEVVGNV
ncbi:PH-domain-containing protein [Ramaria rubella]|nr:PH-domain-containing protein [Ramaria rubella]